MLRQPLVAVYLFKGRETKRIPVSHVLYGKVKMVSDIHLKT